MSDTRLRELVRTRAANCCEYCLLPADASELPHQVDHIVAEQHGGSSSMENLALACFSCNKHKGPNLASIDPLSGHHTPLFNPRTQEWKEHFEWQGDALVGRTPQGRATIVCLNVNSPLRMALRHELHREGRFPPTV